MKSGAASSPGARVAFDVTSMNVNRVGTGIYTRQLTTALQSIIGPRLHAVSFDALTSQEGTKTSRERLMTLMHDVWWLQWGVERAARKADASLLHVPVPLGPVRSRVPLVVTIQDVAVLRFPEKFRRWSRHFARFVLPKVARSARAIIAPSLATKADLVNMLGIPEECVTLIPNGVGEEFTPLALVGDRLQRARARYNLPERFLFTVGALEPRKNIARLLHAVHRLREKPDTSDLQLLHAGPPGWLASDVRETMIALKLHDAVRFLGYVDSEDLATLYAASTVVVYPSLFEGFGLPVAEALACGAAVITSNTSSLPEVGGDVAMLVDPFSVESIASAIAKLWTDDEARAEMSRRGIVHASNYSWTRAARETAALYERLLS